MSLEDAILKHAAAIEKLAAAMGAAQSPSAADKPTRGRASSADKPSEPPKETPKAEVPPATSPAPVEQPKPPTQGEPTIADLRGTAKQLVLKLVGLKGKPTAEALLKSIHADATNVTTTPDEKIGALIVAAQKALA